MWSKGPPNYDFKMLGLEGFMSTVMERTLELAQTGSEKPKKRRSEEEKVGRRKWIIQTLKRMEERQKRIDRRTRMLAAGLRGFLMLGEDYVSMVACKDNIDTAILNALYAAGHTGRSTNELAADLGIDHRDISRRITRMNKRMDEEMEEIIITKQGRKWRLIKRLIRDFAAAREKIGIEEEEKEGED